MNKVSQKDAVFNAVTAVFNEHNRSLDGGEKVKLEASEKTAIIEIIACSISQGVVEFSAEAAAKYSTLEDIKTYSSGLLSNWLRKDVRLNGGEKHKAIRPGLRAGQNDPLIKSLKALRSSLTEQSEIDLIDLEIKSKAEEILKNKSKVDISLIPKNLSYLLK